MALRGAARRSGNARGMGGARRLDRKHTSTANQQADTVASQKQHFEDTCRRIEQTVEDRYGEVARQGEATAAAHEARVEEVAGTVQAHRQNLTEQVDGLQAKLSEATDALGRRLLETH